MSIKKKTTKPTLPLNKTSDLSGEMLWKDYVAMPLFCLYCTLTVIKTSGSRKKGLKVKVHDKDKMAQEGIVYVLVINGYILKIGESIRSFKARLGNYKGGDGSTNSNIRKSILNLNKPVKVYGYRPPKREWCWLETALLENEDKVKFSFPKAAEKFFLLLFKRQHGGKLPIGNKRL